MREPSAGEIEWSRSLFALLRDGAHWGVPRSGLMFQRRGRTLWLAARMPWWPDMLAMGITEAELRSLQDEEFERIKKVFGRAGIEVRE